MKHLVILLITSIILVTNTQTTSVAPIEFTDEQNKQYMIPDEAIRLRILANSEAAVDPDIKYTARARGNERIRDTEAHLEDSEGARTVSEETTLVFTALVRETRVENK